MTSKYTHKFIIYNKKRIKNNHDGLVEKLAEFNKEAIPKDFLENLNDLSELFRKKRQDFYHENPSKMTTIDEILPYNEEINIETNKVLAFIEKYSEFSKLIVGIDYFDDEEEHIEKYFPTDNLSYCEDTYNLITKFVFEYYYGLNGNELNIFLNNNELEHFI